MIDPDFLINTPPMNSFNRIGGSSKLTLQDQMNYSGCTSSVDVFFMPGGLTPTEKQYPLKTPFLKNYMQADANDFYFFFGGDGSLNSAPKSGLLFHCSRFISPLFGSSVGLDITLVVYPIFRWSGVDLNDLLVDLASRRLGHYLADISRNGNTSMEIEFDLIYLKKDLFISDYYHTMIKNGIMNGINY